MPHPFSPIFGLLLLTPGLAAADTPLTEQEAVQLGLQQPEVVARWDAHIDIAEGQLESAGRWANPEIEYSRETLELPSGDSEENTWSIRQRLNLAGVPGLSREAARHQYRASGLRNDQARREWAANIRQHFYQALAAQREAELIADWHRRLTELTTAIEQRVAAGDASRYDHNRLRQELALLEGERLNTRANATSARDRLAQRIGDDQRPLAGRLLPPTHNPVNASAVAQSPLMQALSAETESAEVRAEAAQRQRWPELTLGVGRKEVVEPGFQAEGNVISIGVEIPLFDRHSGQARTQRGRAQQQRAELALARAELRTRLRALQRDLSAERASAQALQESINAPTASLSDIAESSYAAGELSIAELIDAHRSELNTRRALIQRELEARTTFIQLTLLTGETP
ncbi:outer membrane protein TolC [Marinimicrobium koreense]|uniref:Outer membrane protein TolC n=1 Tax=Marinimicrobium koreense TaxID=306545 RepID=A0A3N1NAZ4_9GAMM|nr:TolC family protein [Marinimicrobium koreense]ROQ17064.1 outer membrane protein TolC [Marinimicrobium koreense]